MSLQPSATDGTALRWVKSSYSGSNDNDCVEAAAAPGAVLIRDSKDADGPQLAFPSPAWVEFVSTLPR